MKDYDFGLIYHLSKANVVSDALGKKSFHVSALVAQEFDLIEQF